MKRAILWMTGVVIGLLLGGCAVGPANYYQGALATEETVVPLETGDRQQRWEDLYVVVDYRFQRQGQQLLVDGRFQFADFPRMNMVGVHDFKLKLFLLDENRRVLSYTDIHRVLGSRLDRRDSFRRLVALPAGAVAASFGYEGRFIEDQGGFAGDVWKLPKRDQ